MFIDKRLERWSSNLYMKELSKKLGTDLGRDRISLYYMLSLSNHYFLKNSINRLCNMAKKGVIGLGPIKYPHLYQEILKLRSQNGYTLWAADGSALLFYFETGVYPDVVVSDLDGDPRVYFLAIEHGSTLVVQPHGDNIPLIAYYSSLITRENIVVTSQVEPFQESLPHGGFTDGDRIVFIANQCGLDKIILCCYDFSVITDSHKSLAFQKKEKIEYAKYLLEAIENKKEVKIVRLEF